jgi:hypothetical protein
MLGQKNTIEQGTSQNRSDSHSRRTLPLLIVACALLILVGLLRRSQRDAANSAGNLTNTTAEARASDASDAERLQWVPRRNPATAQTPEAIVAAKVTQFARSRRDIVRAIARRTQQDVPSEIEEFFDALESGVWEQIEPRWKALSSRSAQYEGSTHSPELDPFWPAVLDAYGVAEQAHLWPAQKLLDYGNSILDSLRPGMVYVGGTDNGRWVPELLNETSGAEPHIIVTQNAMADARYLEYMNTLYGERFATLTSDDSQRAFQEYVADAQSRFEHDQKFPDEPKQVRPGEDIRIVDGKVQVSGQVAVMSINEKLLQMLMQKNPDLSFAVQESFPMTGTYANALPLGPLMELGAADGQNAFTPERAAQSLDYWRNTAQQILSDPGATGSSDALKSYSHDAVSAANLLAAHNFAAEAEQAYRLAIQLWPESPESVAGLANLLTASGRANDAQQLVSDFERQYPKQRKDLEGARARGSISR